MSLLHRLLKIAFKPFFPEPPNHLLDGITDPAERERRQAIIDGNYSQQYMNLGGFYNLFAGLLLATTTTHIVTTVVPPAVQVPVLLGVGYVTVRAAFHNYIRANEEFNKRNHRNAEIIQQAVRDKGNERSQANQKGEDFVHEHSNDSPANARDDTPASEAVPVAACYQNNEKIRKAAEVLTRERDAGKQKAALESACEGSRAFTLAGDPKERDGARIYVWDMPGREGHADYQITYHVHLETGKIRVEAGARVRAIIPVYPNEEEEIGGQLITIDAGRLTAYGDPENRMDVEGMESIQRHEVAVSGHTHVGALQRRNGAGTYPQTEGNGTTPDISADEDVYLAHVRGNLALAAHMREHWGWNWQRNAEAIAVIRAHLAAARTLAQFHGLEVDAMALDAVEQSASYFETLVSGDPEHVTMAQYESAMRSVDESMNTFQGYVHSLRSSFAEFAHAGRS